ncbi:DUF883 family protein [Propylenella binzhouense]|nr:DUF883 family protein [Propylenella binzhouense]
MASEATSGRSGTTRSSGADATDGATAEDVKSLSAQIDLLKTDISALAATLSDLARASAREGREKVERTADDYYREGRRQADAVLAEARAVGEEFEDQISRNPLTAVLVALGLGFLIGMISSR